MRLAHQRDGDCAVEQAVVAAIGEEGYYALEDCAREGQCHFVEAQGAWLRQRQAGRQSDWWVVRGDEMVNLAEEGIASEAYHFRELPFHWRARHAI